MPDRDETVGIPEGDGNPEMEKRVESGRRANEEEREDPSRGPHSGPGDDPVESDSEIRGS